MDLDKTEIIQEVYPNMSDELWHSEAWPNAKGNGLELLKPFAEVDPFVSLHVHGATDPLLDRPEVMIVGALSNRYCQSGRKRLFNGGDFEQLNFGATNFPKTRFYALFDYHFGKNTAFKALSFNHPDLEDQIFTSIDYEANR